ncbi:MAG: S8/S53 family peptidase [bacterium]|nr:S8/S53 family peptidase [bacterium]
MRKIIFILGLCLMFSWPVVAGEKPILPTANFTANFCNFPQAWSVSKGKNVRIAVAYEKTAKSYDWVKLTARPAPEAEIKKVPLAGFLGLSPEIAKYQVFLLLQEIGKETFSAALKAVGFFTGKGVTVILPAYFGPMKADYDYGEWRTFIKKASEAGAVIVGVHSRFYQLGNLSFWKEIPVDIFVLHLGFEGDNYFKPGAMVDTNIQWGAYKVAGAAALLKGSAPRLSPVNIKKMFRDRGRKLTWAHVREEGGWERVFAYLNKKSLYNYLRKNEKFKPQVINLFEGRTLDAGLLLGLPPMKDGEWALKTLNVSAAQRWATGKGVTVAILDHLFDKENPALKGRIVTPGSVVPGKPVFSTAGHGTWMARDLVRVAPGVKIMPVMIVGKDRRDYAGLYIKGIEYAVENGADIISLSHRAVPKENQAALDNAVEKASAKGVTFVYIHYYGDREDVVRSGPIEFAGGDEGKKYSYVVGTNFIDESSFPFTWGLSQTAPLVSGVIALVKEINPGLKPLEIKKILLKSNNLSPDGFPLLDALKAVKNAKKMKISWKNFLLIPSKSVQKKQVYGGSSRGVDAAHFMIKED